MKIGFYSPYFDSVSGGERYVLTLASYWSKSHDVSLFSDTASLLSKVEERLHIDMSRVTVTKNIFASRNIFHKLLETSRYDLIFFLTDGSIPTTFARRNILHFQVPFHTVPYHSLKMSRFQAVVCNSEFTKKNLDRRVGKKSIVIYPPVDPITRAKSAKKHMILSVGRFHPLKKQDVLIAAFKKLVKNKAAVGYELVLAGGVLPADEAYLASLRASVGKYKISILPNAPFRTLTQLYNQASVYWHGAGFKETKPEHMEHFGITTVEAMSAGVVPIVFDGGGLPEIIEDGISGYLWQTPGELVSKTLTILGDEQGRDYIARAAYTRSGLFTAQAFTHAFDELLSRIS